MKTCPYCKSELSWRAVKYTRPNGKKWYQYSNSPLLVRSGAYCQNELVAEPNERWYYKLASWVYLFAFVLLIILGGELSNYLRYGLLLVVILAFVIQVIGANDYQYITLDSQSIRRIKALVEYAGDDLEKPIELSAYSEKYSVPVAELNRMISVGLIDCYSFGGLDFLNDEAPRSKDMSK